MLADDQALISFSDKIRQCNLDRYGIHVPQIAVLGVQSSGKSSVLESITGIAFPRDASLCTRGPMEVRMKACHTEEQQRIVVSPSEEAERQFELGAEQSPEFADHLKTLVNASVAGNTSKFTDQVIIIEVHRLDQIPFTVIDLPGYYQCTDDNDDQDSADARMVHAINDVFLTQDATIILHVVPSNQDPATLESWRVCNRVDPEHTRTIGVLTKFDAAEKVHRLDWMGRISGTFEDKYSNKLGYYVLRCRSSEEVQNGLTLEHLRLIEQRLIEKCMQEAAATNMGRGRSLEFAFGQQNLVAALSRELVTRIKKSLPDIRRKVADNLSCAEYELDVLGEGLETSESRRILLSRVREAINHELDEVKDGTILHDLPQSPRSFWKWLASLEDELQAGTESALGEWETRDTGNPRSRTLPPRALKPRQIFGLTEIVTLLQEPLVPETKTTELPSQAAILSEIRTMITMKRSHRLQGFLDFDLFRKLIANCVHLSRERAELFCEKCTALVQFVLMRATRAPDVTTAEASLYRYLSETIMGCFRTKHAELKQDVAKICNNEITPSRLSLTLRRAATDTTTGRARDLADEEELLEMLKRYWEACSLRLVDNVSLTVRRVYIAEFLDKMVDNIISNLDDETLERVAREDEQTTTRRAALKQAVNGYERALQLLSEVASV